MPFRQAVAPTPPSPAPPSTLASAPGLFAHGTGGTLISLVDLRSAAQRHWWLAGEGFPQRIAALLAAPLHATGQPAANAAELAEIFAPLPAIAAAEAHPACRQAAYRYLLCLRQGGVRLSCWRQYPGVIGWQRRCGPMALAAFIRRFGAPRGASS